MQNDPMQPFYDLITLLIQVSLSFIVVMVVIVVIKAFANKNRKNNRENKKKKPHLKAVSVSEDKPKILTLELLQQIEWKNFENVCCAYFIEKGFDAKATQVGADGGVDIELYKKSTDQLIMIMQCKAHSSNIGVKDIREFYGALAASHANRGIFLATKSFTKDALSFADGKSPELQLCNGERLMKLIQKLPEKSQQNIFQVAIQGDYKTPTCASCDIKMVVRQGGNGSFFGCANYPRCRTTMKIKA